MTETTRRLTYSVPLILIAALLLVENGMPRPYVFNNQAGPISHLYYKVLRPESLRYSEALIALSAGYRLIGEGQNAQAAEKIGEAVDYLAEVNKAWTFQALPPELGGDAFDNLKKDLPTLAAQLGRGNFASNATEHTRTLAYLGAARAKLANGAIL